MKRHQERQVVHGSALLLFAALLAGCSAAPRAGAEAGEIDQAVVRAELEREAAQNRSSLTSRETGDGELRPST